LCSGISRNRKRLPNGIRAHEEGRTVDSRFRGVCCSAQKMGEQVTPTRGNPIQHHLMGLSRGGCVCVGVVSSSAHSAFSAGLANHGAEPRQGAGARGSRSALASEPARPKPHFWRVSVFVRGRGGLSRPKNGHQLVTSMFLFSAQHGVLGATQIMVLSSFPPLPQRWLEHFGAVGTSIVSGRDQWE